MPDVLVPFMGGITFLPFVRDSKGAPTVPKPPPSKPAGASTPAAATSAPPPPRPSDAPAAVAAAPASGPEADLAAQITAKGDEVRALKTAKVMKYRICHV